MKLFDAETRALYARQIDAEKRTSLSALFDLVPAGADVLDVGIGAGALGERLVRERRCQVDGITISDEEAANAAAHYRRIEVADLNTINLNDLFGATRYGAIVCADVLEHLTHPTRVLDACRKLLTDDGVLLLSIPNVAYIGLLGELLGGEFRYRIEGLLDRTHVRFFTRRSLLRMLQENRWHVDLVEPIKLDLPESEFRVTFDDLPPAVQRYLLAMPDGLTYQFVVRARAVAVDAPSTAVELTSASVAAAAAFETPHFSALLYLKHSDGYHEQSKLVAQGRIGDARQRIRFVLPALDQPLQGLRFDPADRAGFLHLYGLRLYGPDGALVWEWDHTPEALLRGANQQVVFRMGWLTTDTTMLLLTGEDPFFELPLPGDVLARCQYGGALEAELGWPMSADYAMFVGQLAERQSKVESLEQLLKQANTSAADSAERLERALSAADELSQRLERALTAEAEALHQLQTVRETLTSDRELLRVEAEHRGHEARRLREELAFASTSLEQQRRASGAANQEIAALRQRLARIEQSWVFKATAPFAPQFRTPGPLGVAPATRSRSGHASRAHGRTALDEEVDVIVPVYKGLDETRVCIESVLRSTPQRQFRLVLVNDASPEPEITQYLRVVCARDARVDLLENGTNLGFVASVNRGIRRGERRDVVLLNSDTEVAGDWLDRLHRAAYSEARIGTVTPFSNSATICSYPRFCGDNPLPAGFSTATLDRLFSAANAGRTAEIPTAVGFCMFIRRECLNAVGMLDVDRFGRGYGEENDFCMRARKAGWQHLLALDTFVHHAGGVSFGSEKERRVREAQQTLGQLHPEYQGLVEQHIAADPARVARLAVDAARIRTSGLPAVLLVSHGLGGGTERHLRELADLLEEYANVFALRPSQAGETQLEWLRAGEDFRLGFRLDDDYEALVTALKALGIGLVHYHHLLAHSPSMWGLPNALGVAHDFTVHDFYSFCPQITLTDQSKRYCGEEGIGQCSECLRRTPAPGAVSIETWRAGYRSLIDTARYVFAPSAEAGMRMQRYFPAARIVQVPHLDMDEPPPVAAPQPLAEGRALRIVVVGALSVIKGADVLEAAAVEAARRGIDLEFHLLGFGYRPLRKQPKARLTVHGEYDQRDLPDLLSWLKPDLAWFPALWPETYSYTLSACLNAGLPIVAPDFGAFPERLHGRAWTWLCPWDRPATEWVRFFERLRREHFMTGVGPASASGLVATESTFSYGQDYLRGVVVPADTPLLTHEFLGDHLPDRPAHVAKPVKRALYATAVRLRRAPVLRTLAQRVPSRWRVKTKAWLDR